MAGIPGRSGGANRRSAKDHQLRGSYRADRHGPLPPDEPPPPDAYPPPADLTGSARRHWRYFAPLLQSARVQTPSDIQTLADYCRACAAVEDRDRRLAGVMRKRQIDWSVQTRLDRELRGWMERKAKLASELGLTPLSRSRVGWTGHYQLPHAPTSTPAEPKSKLTELQEQAVALRRPVGVQ